MDKPPTHITRNDDFSKLQSLFSKNLPKKPINLCFPTSIFAIVLLLILGYNSFTIFYFIPIFSMENVKETEKNMPISQLSSSRANFAMNDESFPKFSTKTHVKSSHNSPKFTHLSPKTIRRVRQVIKPPSQEPLHEMRSFSRRVRRFFDENSCKFRVFMTWISSIKSFGDREKFTIESLFKFHPNACLIIVSNSMDSNRGSQILEPFVRLNFKVMAVSPDFKFIFKNTMAAIWYQQLEKGNVKPGEISLGQNLSNLLRLSLLYKYGGVYMDTDFIVIKRLDTLRNVIGAQTVDPKTKNWSRLNNALMIFDKKHPLLIKFIVEFALTFDGNKWGHNGPYLVSRVVERVTNSSTKGGASKFTVLPPSAFYVVEWGKVGDLFRKPMDELHQKWLDDKIDQIERDSYAIHLWNRQSREIKVEDGSIIRHLMKKACVFCNVSRTIS
ncbi:lactosylceramide 4-alpha-galactosyltransferase-like [Chenopodium quinoa]|nr:lactosylceramide 4-alpha-galactosyltransferase-like [Chenopodium quinoa]